MKHLHVSLVFAFMLAFITACEDEKAELDYSGVYCLNIQNLEMTIVNAANGVTFSLQNDLLVNGSGMVSGDTLILTAQTAGNELFVGKLFFSEDGQSFSGPYQISDGGERITSSGILLGTKGVCSSYDLESKGIPRFIVKDFTQLQKIEKISKFRSGFGHSSTDGTEECRSMKHYYTPFIQFRENNSVEIYAPVTGTIVSVSNDGHGSSTGLNNKEIQIKPEDQPAFVLVLYHCDLTSSAIATGRKVQAGDLLAYASLYDQERDEYSTSFDIALWVNTPSGARLLSYFDAMTEDVFQLYMDRGGDSRQDFVITKEARDADPLLCDGESFLNEGNLENWMILN